VHGDAVPWCDPEACRLAVPGRHEITERHLVPGGDVLADDGVRGDPRMRIVSRGIVEGKGLTSIVAYKGS
jgi:hypothetical protein